MILKNKSRGYLTKKLEYQGMQRPEKAGLTKEQRTRNVTWQTRTGHTLTKVRNTKTNVKDNKPPLLNNVFKIMNLIIWIRNQIINTSIYLKNPRGIVKVSW